MNNYQISHPLGLLFSNEKELNYLDFQNSQTLSLGQFPEKIKAIGAHQGDVYLAIERRVHSLLGEFVSNPRHPVAPVKILHVHQDRLLDGGYHGLVDTLENKVLVSRDFTRGNGDFEALYSDCEGRLYGTVLGGHSTPSFWRIVELFGKDGISSSEDFIEPNYGFFEKNPSRIVKDYTSIVKQSWNYGSVMLVPSTHNLSFHRGDYPSSREFPFAIVEFVRRRRYLSNLKWK